nr:MAG TPA: hypothetical protein [Caudoviricetes sp.]
MLLHGFLPSFKPFWRRTTLQTLSTPHAIR